MVNYGGYHARIKQLLIDSKDTHRGGINNENNRKLVFENFIFPSVNLRSKEPTSNQHFFKFQDPILDNETNPQRGEIS